MAADTGRPEPAEDGDADPDRRRALLAYLRPRARLVATAVAVGAAAGTVLALGLTIVFDPMFAARKAFGVGLLALGFGVVGWSGSVIAGPGFENMQRHLDTGSDWSEMDSRRAMSRVASFGFGVALLAPPVTTVLGA
jgi:hypothetical protein